MTSGASQLSKKDPVDLEDQGDQASAPVLGNAYLPDPEDPQDLVQKSPSRLGVEDRRATVGSSRNESWTRLEHGFHRWTLIGRNTEQSVVISTISVQS